MNLRAIFRDRSEAWRAKAVARILLLVAIAAAVVALAGVFGIARDYGYLRGSILSGSEGGRYHALATRIADRARREHGRLTVIATAGSIENVKRLATGGAHCSEMFALIQDGTPVSADMNLELLGRLPEPESLLLLGRRGNAFKSLGDLRGTSIGIGPEGSGTAYLVRQLLSDKDLRDLDIRLAHHDLAAQAELVAQGKLDVAAVVMQEDAELLGNLIRQHDLDIIAPRDLEGLVARHHWLTVGQIPAGRYDLVRHIPSEDKQVARLNTLLIAGPCAPRADRIALLMLVSAELRGFARSNPPQSTSSATVLPLAREAQQFFVTGEPELADRYFPWLVNLMSPAYWVYLVMAVTILFNAMNGFSRFRLWRLDAAREKLETEFKALIDPKLADVKLRSAAEDVRIDNPTTRQNVEGIMTKLLALRARCIQQTKSFFTPMGAEMYYRYQEALVDQAIDSVAAALKRSPHGTSERGA